MTDLLLDWPTVYPRVAGPWTVRRGDQWGVLDPERGSVTAVEPSSDRRLPGLATALESGDLVGYRYGRRAIVATPTSFIKVVRPSRVDALVTRHEVLGGAGRPFGVPVVRDATPDGRVELTVAAGQSLHQSRRCEPRRRIDDIARLLASLHAQPLPSQLSARNLDEPRTWVETSRRMPTEHLLSIERTAATLPPLPVRAQTIVHGDLHDKNIFCDAKGDDRRLALIDLDGLGIGAPEDDVANLAVHLELRNLQGRTGLRWGDRASALYRGYQRARPLDADRLRLVERHTWFRLACLYQFRRSTADLVPQLLRAAADGPGEVLRPRSDCSTDQTPTTLNP